MGPLDAPVTIVEFSDFQCPFCAKPVKRLDSLRAAYPTQVSIVYRHFPLPEHRYAIAAIRASECAANQGRFEAFHNVVFATQDSIGSAPWSYFARAAGVPDTALFAKCTKSDDPIAALALDAVAAKQLGVRATPTLLINQTELLGAQPLDTLIAYTTRALRRASAVSGATRKTATGAG